MLTNLMNSDPICAPASPQGTGAVALVRVSGDDCRDRISPIFGPDGLKTPIDKMVSHKAYFAKIYDGDAFLDEVLVTFFASPHSYTGEDSIEISCHGSTYIVKRIMELLIDNGIRLAEPGEFTMRAFRNGKLDLSQAEAVADLIASQSKAAHDIAARQMRGNYSQHIRTLRKKLVDFTALIELELDFAEEDVTFADRTALSKLLNEIKDDVTTLSSSFKAGNAIKNGIPVAIVGKPNVGKSTLLNAILREDKAIVSAIPGTTRDSIEDVFNIEGFTFRFIDTAGIRHKTDDEIEKIGIERTFGKIKEAMIVLYVTDAESFDKNETCQFADIINDPHRLFVTVVNKSDLYQDKKIENKGVTLYISAKQCVGIDELERILVDFAKTISGTHDTIVSNTRHYNALQNALDALNKVENGLTNGLPNDLLAIDLRAALTELGVITGEEITNDEVLGTIFGKFCIGK